MRSPGAARALSRRIGAPERATVQALAAAVPVLVSAFARQATAAPGQRLLAAVDQVEGAAVLADLPATLGAAPPDVVEALLEDAVGQRPGAVEAQIARPAGIDPVQARAVLAAAATVLLGALSHTRRRRRWSAHDLARALAAELTLAEDAVPGSIGILEEVLEADAEAELGDDVTEVGSRLLGRLCEE